MKRRALFAAAAAGLAMPRIGYAQARRVVRFVPQVDLAVVDPIVNTNTPTRNHAYLVFDTLYGADEDYVVQPQMVAGHTVDADFSDWMLTLRDGLRFHDGAPVLARDVVASLRRWGANDVFGSSLLEATAELSAPDDRSVRFRMKRRFRLLPNALGKLGPNQAAIMPERIASADPKKPVTELVGSGPFRWVADERVPGARAVYAKFTEYVPRTGGTPGLTSGPKIVNVDRVEWITIPDAATAAAALQAGEVDWVEIPPPDLLPILRRNKGIVVETRDPTGANPILRFNHLQPPFDNVRLRRAILRAVDQTEFMSAYSSDRSLWRVKAGAFTRGTPMATETGLEDLFGPTDFVRAKREVAESGYHGETIVFPWASDALVESPMAQVAVDLFQRIGISVDSIPLDAGLTNQRRTKMGPVSQGGWNMITIGISGVNNLNPPESILMRGNGEHAWFGWPTIPALEQLRQAFMDAADPSGQRRICEAIQQVIFDQVPHVPLGQVLEPTAYRSNITGMLNGFPKFWNIRKG